MNLFHVISSRYFYQIEKQTSFFNLYQVFFDIFAFGKGYSVKEKYAFLDKTLSNIFLSDEKKKIS
jgi:hypothetical protein